MIRHEERVGIRGMPPGGTEEKELGWLGWSDLRDLSRDGTKVLFEEEADGGGPNYTVFLRDTDGSPPVQLDSGVGKAISPDGKSVITIPTKTGPLSIVPTGAGEARQLTHDNISYGDVRYLPDGKQLLASGIEPGHGARDYLIDIKTGDAKPVTPEGISGVTLSSDGRKTVVIGPDGKWSVWPLDGGGLKPIPGLDSKYYPTGWSPDGASIYVAANQQSAGAEKIYEVNVATGKMQFWKSFGNDLKAGVASVGGAEFSPDGRAYAYVYDQVLAEAYVVKGLK
jgi:eukaryotic-like serine/threonine-protein kinase